MNSVLTMVRGNTPSADPHLILLHRDADAAGVVENAARGLGAQVVSVASFHELLQASRGEGWGCVVVDYAAFHSEIAAQLKSFAAAHPTFPVVVWSSQLEVPLSVEALKSGAVDALRKPLDNAALSAVLKEALRIGRDRLDALAEKRELAKRYEQLAPSEKAVLALVMKGRTNKEVSNELDCSLRTVEAKRQRILRILQAENALELAAILAKHDLLDKAISAESHAGTERAEKRRISAEPAVVAKPAPVTTSGPHWGDRVSQVS